MIYNYIIYYILIGVVFNLIYDLIVDLMKNEDIRFNIHERIIVGIFWPLYIIAFTINFFKALSKNKKDD